MGDGCGVMAAEYGAGAHLFASPSVRAMDGRVGRGDMGGAEAISSMTISTIIADGDFDGLVAAAVLHRVWPESAVIFSHPLEVRSGHLDELINATTALCDLPFQPDCGLYIDHHETNRPTPEQKVRFESRGGCIHWEEKDSAARVAYDLFKNDFDLSSLTPVMDMVDRLDSGKITLDEFLSDDDTIWLARTVSSKEQDYTLSLLDMLSGGMSVEDIVRDDRVAERITRVRHQMDEMRALLNEKSMVVDRLAVSELQETGLRTNGYLITAHFGEKCDACLIIHGSMNAVVGGDGEQPLSASFFTNSFLHRDGGVFDLTRMATKYDQLGGGHKNACGCRIMPLSDDGVIESRDLTEEDIRRNVAGWLAEWSGRN